MANSELESSQQMHIAEMQTVPGEGFEPVRKRSSFIEA